MPKTLAEMQTLSFTRLKHSCSQRLQLQLPKVMAASAECFESTDSNSSCKDTEELQEDAV